MLAHLPIEFAAGVEKSTGDPRAVTEAEATAGSHCICSRSPNIQRTFPQLEAGAGVGRSPDVL